MKIKPFNYRGTRFCYVEKSTLGNDYLLIKRPVSMSELKRRGMCVTGIDAHRDNFKPNVLKRILKEVSND